MNHIDSSYNSRGLQPSTTMSLMTESPSPNIPGLLYTPPTQTTESSSESCMAQIMFGQYPMPANV